LRIWFKKRVNAVGYIERTEGCDLLTLLSRKMKQPSVSESETDVLVDSNFDPDTDSGCESGEDPDESAEFYDGLFETFQKQGPTLGNHADSTKKMIEEQEVQWTR
jgi:hypothetical protein